ncbi:MAG: undecaprenyl-phosphate glucose phosphotransferase, partial [Burkholderiaceae bacterium]|nr:undecaprenyl-phosphate glucose phosphotransferase [Burkholderiaceae bacterium]
MYEQISDKIVFRRAPQPVEWLIAAMLDPAVTVFVYQAASYWYDAPAGRAGFILCLIVFGLTFPGRNRFHMLPLRAAIDIAASWLVVLAVLGLIGYATNSLSFFLVPVLWGWTLTTPVAQWGGVLLGQQVLARRAAHPSQHRPVVVIGSGVLGAKVAQAMRTSPERISDFIGFFDDRTGDRVGPGISAPMLG